jgi:thymidine kinase
MAKGGLEVICGSMYSGKTEELMRRLKRAEYAKQRILTIKHHIDNRVSYTSIASHDGKTRTATPIEGTDESLQRILLMANGEVDVVGIDEAQFFPNEIVEIVKTLLERGKRVVVAGLDMDFRGEPFGVMPQLLALADHVIKLRAICMQCGQDANFTQRLINGLPARYDDPVILVGARECYEARCRECYKI